MEIEIRYSKMLRELLDDHSNVVTLLAEGFKEAKKHIKVKQLFLDCSSATLCILCGCFDLMLSLRAQMCPLQ